ncbi:hypothetical protein PAHAL_9G191800 [Panicum hallii]|uniref:Extensin domain-containing protein n=1 Tax=Panicum hallii TaxID=206008 RepID=A0A2S3IKU5_9POAL|nr:hypothetical protein PAHAL_9G191800 [Panicum hallii]
MTMSSYRLVAPTLLILALALVSSGAEQGCATREQAPAYHTSPVPPPDGRHDHRQEGPMPTSRPLGLRIPVAAPPPPRAGTPWTRSPLHPSPPPPPPPPCS